MNVEEYLRDLTPLNIVELFPRAALQHFLNGFSAALGAGIALIYPRTFPAKHETLERLDCVNTEGRGTTFLDLCTRWRDEAGCGQNSVCISADEVAAMRHFHDVWRGPRVYRCPSLHLWDMTYPLIANSRVIGVLVGGQLAVAGEINWRREMADFASRIDWDTCPDLDSHLDDVRFQITTTLGQIPGADRLLRILDTPLEHGRTVVTVETFRQRVGQFLEFGKMTQELLGELHKSRKRIMERELERYFDQKLNELDPSDKEEFWWDRCQPLLDEFNTLLDTKTVQLFAWQGPNYVRKAPRGLTTNAPNGIDGRILVGHTFPVDELVPVELEGTAEPGGSKGTDQDSIWGYRSWMGKSRDVCSTLITFHGKPSLPERELYQDLCRQICASADFAQLHFRERKVDADYRREVRLIGHSFRTPLQALQFLLERIAVAPEVASSPDLLAKVHDGLGRILDARQDLFLLIEPPIDQQERVFDLADLLRQVVKSMKPIAEKHPCIIVSSGMSTEVHVSVRGVRYRLQRALADLLDNAIKYSYVGLRKETGTLHEVRVRLNVAEGYARVIIENYGIGFTPDKLAALAEHGVRGEVKDYRLARPGSGLGLPFAIEVFHEMGGWINVSSLPAISATEEEIRSYHRYKTAVEAVLPLATRSQND
jgi:signal transduction histidine kinase